MYRTNSSFHNPLVSAPPPLFPTSNYKEKKCLAFYSSEIHRLYIRTQFGLVMRLRLCISPCRQPNLQLPAHMGALAGKLWGNRLGKVVPFFIWKKTPQNLELTLCDLFNMTLRNSWDLRTSILLTRALNIFFFFIWIQALCELSDVGKKRFHRPLVKAQTTHHNAKLHGFATNTVCMCECVCVSVHLTTE